MSSAVVSEMLIRIAADTAQLRSEMDQVRRQVGGDLEGIKSQSISLKGALVGLFAGLGIATAAKEFVEAADGMALLSARLKTSTGSAENFAKAQADIYAIAQQNNVGIRETTELYTKLNAPVTRLGGGVKETTAIVNAFSTSLRLGGANTQEAASATLQFAQAMGSGKLQGDEFHSIAEASPRFMKALADGMGVPIEQLKKMGSEGKLTADVVGNALMKSLDGLKKEAASMPDTVGGSLQRMKNDILLTIDELNQSSGLTLGIAGLISGVNNLLPVIKGELLAGFSAVGEIIERNKDKLAEIWLSFKDGLSEVWELGKVVAGILVYLVEMGVQTGFFKASVEAVRIIIAGIRDGMEIIGATFALVGAQILKVLGIFSDSAKTAAEEAEKAGLAVYQRFANGDTHFAKLQQSMGEVAQQSAAMGGASKLAADQLKGTAAAADMSSDSLHALKGKHTELTTEQKHAIAAYKKLTDGINDKIGVMDAEMSGQTKMTEAQKYALKIMQDIGEGSLKLTDAQKREVAAKLELLLNTDALNTAAKKEAELKKENEVAYKNFTESLTKHNDTLRKAVEKQIEENDMLRLGADGMAKLELARLKDTLAIAKQTVANDELLGYCNAETAAHRDTLDALEDLIAARENGVHLKAAKEAADEWKKTSDSINTSLTDSLMRAFEAGKGYGKALRDTLVNTFKTTVLSPTIKAIMSPITGAIGSLFGGNAAAADGSGASGSGSLLGGVLGAIGGIGSGLSMFGAGGLGGALVGGAGWLTGATTLSGSLGAAGTLIGSGGAGILPGLAMGAGALAPIALGLGAAYTLYKSLDHGNTPHQGGVASYSAQSGLQTGSMADMFVNFDPTKRDWLSSANESSGNIAKGITTLLDTISSSLGKSTGYTVGTGYQDDSSSDGAWGALKIALGGSTVVDWRKGNDNWPGREFADGENGLKEYSAALAQSVRGALDSMGLPNWATKMLDSLGNAPTLEQLSAAADKIAAVQASLTHLSDGFTLMGGVFSQVAQLSDDAKLSFIDMAGGIDALISKAKSFVDSYYSDSEKAGIQAKEIQDAFKSVGLDASHLTTKDDFRALVETRDVNTEIGRQQLAELLTIAPSFAALADYMKENQTTFAEVEKLAPAIVALAPVLNSQTTAVEQQNAASVTATNAVTQAVVQGSNAQVVATNAAAEKIANAVTQAINEAATNAGNAAGAANAAVIALTSKLDAIDSNNRLNESRP